ncbi:MAG: hypothetical protein P4L85_21665 [Paludisphaera borealis]|uniref:hypothetical protein n=1 Tax=Paludisphaera borealis TaxID=1387353 RepID=UPI002841E0EA|nr:hypothetical protein [Paludisphaera borealis]MDR3621973.1 hypothetical protein [Paludisphaera borealis]
MRIKTWHLLVGVAVVGFVLCASLGAVKGSRRWNVCRERAAHFGELERISRDAISQGGLTQGQVVTAKRLAEVAARKRWASELAAFIPWAPLPEPFSVSPGPAPE